MIMCSKDWMYSLEYCFCYRSSKRHIWSNICATRRHKSLFATLSLVENCGPGLQHCGITGSAQRYREREGSAKHCRQCVEIEYTRKCQNNEHPAKHVSDGHNDEKAKPVKEQFQGQPPEQHHGDHQQGAGAHTQLQSI